MPAGRCIHNVYTVSTHTHSCHNRRYCLLNPPPHPHPYHSSPSQPSLASPRSPFLPGRPSPSSPKSTRSAQLHSQQLSPYPPPSSSAHPSSTHPQSSCCRSKSDGSRNCQDDLAGDLLARPFRSRYEGGRWSLRRIRRRRRGCRCRLRGRC